MRTLWVASLLGVVLGASPLPAQQTDSAAPAPRPPKSSSTLINEDDIDNVRATAGSAYDVVRLLRPRWLRQRSPMLPPREGSTMQQEFHVYVDDHEMGGLDFLRSLPAEQVYTLRFLSVAEVGARYGPSGGPGIVVTLRR